MLELSAAATEGGNAFRLFVQRAQLVVTGLMHISILLLPRALPSSSPPPAAAPSKPGRGGKASTAAAASSGNGAPSAAADGLPGEVPAPGFPADGSDLAAWQQVRTSLECHSTSGLDWDSCCLYEVTEERGAEVGLQPQFPVSSTAAYYASQGKKEALICNCYDEK